MAGALRKTMVYLGLAEEDARERYDDAYADYEEYDDHEAAPAQGHDREQHAVVTPLRGAVRPVADREVNQMSRITTIHPRTYNEAKMIGESFREGIPVIMNLSDMSDADAKRLVDFAGGPGLRPPRLDRADHGQGLPPLPGQRRSDRRGRRVRAGSRPVQPVLTSDEATARSQSHCGRGLLAASRPGARPPANVVGTMSEPETLRLTCRRFVP